MIDDAAQVLVVDHSEGEAALVDVSVQTAGNAHQDYLNHLLKLISRHLHFVQKTFRSKDFIVDDSKASRGMLRLIILLIIGVSSASFHLFELSEVALGHQLIQVVAVADIFFFDLEDFRHVPRFKGFVVIIHGLRCCSLVTLLVLKSVYHF